MIRWLVTALWLAALPASAEGLRRFAIVAGNDEGGDDTQALLYARDDARKIHGILTRLGGTQPDDARLLLNESADKFLSALSEMERRSKEASQRGERTVLFVYYSGHAKDGVLRLGSTEIPFESLKNRLAQAPADVRIAIFDACQSGEMTRTKGARRAPEFAIEADSSRAAKGMVILTSSAANEDSQESDQIGGSYFSHHLASGLLGDADKSGDGRVSLSEAYAYAYDRTVADTASSVAGAQHPTFHYDLAGNGDVVMTDVATRREGIHFPANAPAGVYYLVDSKGFVAAEVWKGEDQEKRLGVPSGSYKVKRRLSDKLRIGDIYVSEGQMVPFDETTLRDAPFSDDPVKGPGRVHQQLRKHMSFGFVPTYQAFFDAPTRAGLFPPAPLFGLELSIHNFFGRNWIWAFDLALGGSQGSLHVESLDQFLPFKFGELTAGSTIVHEWPNGDLIPYAGARLALILMTREFTTDLLRDNLKKQQMSTFSPGAVFGVRYRLARHWNVGVRGRVHYLLYNVDENRSLGYWELATMLNYEM